MRPSVSSSPWKGIWRRERGQSLVELALSMPILILLTMGIVDIGFLLYAYVQVSAAAGVGARVAAATVTDAEASIGANDNTRAEAVQDAVETSMGRLNIATDWSKTDDVSLQYHTMTPPAWYEPDTRAGDEVTVAVTYRQPIFFAILPGIVNQKILMSSSTRARLP